MSWKEKARGRHGRCSLPLLTGLQFMTLAADVVCPLAKLLHNTGVLSWALCRRAIQWQDGTMGLNRRLRTGGHERFYKSEGYDAGTNVLRMVGYFSLTGLLRVHTLVGDYAGALRALGAVHPFQRANLFAPKIAGARRSYWGISQIRPHPFQHANLFAPNACPGCTRAPAAHAPLAGKQHLTPAVAPHSSLRSCRDPANLVDCWVSARRLQHRAVLLQRVLLPAAAALPGRRARVQHRAQLHLQVRLGPSGQATRGRGAGGRTGPAVGVTQLLPVPCPPS